MEAEVLRKAGPNEKRCIIRHNLGFYSNLAVAVIYSIPSTLVSRSQLQQPNFYAWALNECVAKHPLLTATIRNANTNDPEYTRCNQLNLQNHIRLLHLSESQIQHKSSDDDSELQLLRQIFEQIHDDASLRFSSVESRPAWALDIVPRLTTNESEYYRVFVSFSYSHSHGDGMSGIAFHRSFHAALQQSVQNNNALGNLTISCPRLPIPEQPDTPSKMPISLSYLLRPALATYLPTFLARLLGIWGDPVTGADDQSWTGSKTFTDTNTPGMKVTTNIEIFHINASTLTSITQVCKTHNVKLTALLNYLIAHALKQTLTNTNPTTSHTNLISTIPVNLRPLQHVPQDTIGNYGGAAYLRYDLSSLSTSQPSIIPWQTLQTHAAHLSTISSTSQNQPLGLLRFVSDFPSWFLGQIGQTRGCSWELSNLGVFDAGTTSSPPTDTHGGSGSGTESVGVERILFSQPASPTGPPFCANAVALRGGGLSLVTSWQPGALEGLGGGEQGGAGGEGDREVIRRIHREIEALFGRVAEMV